MNLAEIKRLNLYGLKVHDALNDGNQKQMLVEGRQALKDKDGYITDIHHRAGCTEVMAGFEEIFKRAERHAQTNKSVLVSDAPPTSEA